MHSDPGSDARGGGSDTNRDEPPSDRYAPAEYVPDRTVRQPITDDDWGGTHEDLEELESAIEEVRQLQAHRYDAVGDVLHHTFLDVVPGEDDLYSNALLAEIVDTE